MERKLNNFSSWIQHVSLFNNTTSKSIQMEEIFPYWTDDPKLLQCCYLCKKKIFLKLCKPKVCAILRTFRTCSVEMISKRKSTHLEYNSAIL